MTLAKMCKPTPVMKLSTKNPKLYNFCKILTGKLPGSLEGLNSSLAQSASELWWCKVAHTGFQSMNILYTGSQHVKAKIK